MRDKPLNIEQIKERTKLLEKMIKQLIENYEVATEVTVKSVELQRLRGVSGIILSGIDVEVCLN